MVASRPWQAVIHLAAISNDPSSELDPALTEAVNLDGLEHLFRQVKADGRPAPVYASSASVYGLKQDAEVTEELSLEPLTQYARLKVRGEEILVRARRRAPLRRLRAIGDRLRRLAPAASRPDRSTCSPITR